MLTGNLNLSRFRKGIVTPSFLPVNGKNVNLCANLIDLFEQASGHKRYEIEEEIKAYYVEKVNPKVIQGFAKILFNRSEFLDYGEEDPKSTRQAVFTASAEYWQKSKLADNLSITSHKEAILESINIKHEEAFENTDTWLYGDILSNQKLVAFKQIEPEDLIHRFNIEQVQGLLLHVRTLELKVFLEQDNAFKQVIQLLKFFQLMFEVTGTEKNWLTLHIDGPSSILENARSYGMEIANFFPAILLLKVPWHLNGTLKVPGRHRLFQIELSNQNDYRTFYREKGVWKQEKVVNLINRFNEKYSDTHLAKGENTIIPLRGNRFLIPDIVIKEEGNSNKTILVEWVFYLTDASLKRISQLVKEIPRNYVFALRGKQNQMGSLPKKLGAHLLIFAKEATAPALLKKFKEFDALALFSD